MEVELSLTDRELRNTIVRMLRDKKISLALKLLLTFKLNNSRVPFYDYFNNKEVDEFVDSIKEKNNKIKSVTFCELRDPCNKITYNLH